MNTLNLPLPLTKGTCPRELQQRGSSLRRAGTLWAGIQGLETGWGYQKQKSSFRLKQRTCSFPSPFPTLWQSGFTTPVRYLKGNTAESLKLKLVKAQTLTLGCLVHILTFPLFTCESLDKFTSSLGPNFLVWKIGIIHLYKFISRMKIDKIENHWIRNTRVLNSPWYISISAVLTISLYRSRRNTSKIS